MAKNELQEIFQKRKQPLPVYRTVMTSSQPMLWRSRVTINEGTREVRHFYGKALSSKINAEMDAASHALGYVKGYSPSTVTQPSRGKRKITAAPEPIVEEFDYEEPGETLESEIDVIDDRRQKTSISLEDDDPEEPINNPTVPSLLYSGRVTPKAILKRSPAGGGPTSTVPPSTPDQRLVPRPPTGGKPPKVPTPTPTTRSVKSRLWFPPPSTSQTGITSGPRPGVGGSIRHVKSLPAPIIRKPPHLTKDTVLIVDVENKPKIIEEVLRLDWLPDNFWIYAFVGKHHPQADIIDQLVDERIVKIISPCTRKDGTDTCIQMMVGTFLYDETFEAYLICTQDHFGGNLVEFIKNEHSDMIWKGQHAVLVTSVRLVQGALNDIGYDE